MLRMLEAMRNVVVTCCILHNMLLKHDGYNMIGQDIYDYIMKHVDGIDVDEEWPDFALGYSDDKEETTSSNPFHDFPQLSSRHCVC